jgi:aminoglycoside/choline kinase family phosphotransferase
MPPRENAPRIAGIRRWLAARGHETERVAPLTGDISLRRYFRAVLGDGGTAVVAYYPLKLRPVCRRFRVTTALLEEAGVPVPQVIAADCSRGLMLLADSGERTLYEEAPRPWSELAAVYRQAVSFLRRIQELPRETVRGLNPPLDEALLRWELKKSWDLFLAPEGLAGPPALAERLRQGLDALCARLGDEATLVPCHRDYMPRNLMRGPGERLLVLDHQDLRLGPLAYDLASLLNDSLFPPASLESELVGELLPGEAGELAYRGAVVQRTIKAIGNYRDFARRGFDRHLGLVRPTLSRAWRCMPAVPELAPLVDDLRPLWQPWLEADLLD